MSMVEPPYLIKDFNSFINESITRHSNAILRKSRKYESNYIKCSWVKKENPFIIALSSYSQINYGREFIYPMLAFLYGFYYNPIKNEYTKISSITKPDTTSNIPIGIFEKEEYNHISAIIFSCTLTLGKLTSLAISKGNYIGLNNVINIRLDNEQPFYNLQKVSSSSPEELDDGLFIFFNPNTINKVDSNIFKNSNIVKVNVQDDQLKIESNSLPLVARLNTILPPLAIDNFMEEIWQKYNPRFIISEFKILAICFETDQKEIKLLDKKRNLCVYVDILDKNIKEFKNKNVSVNDDVVCAIYSLSSIAENTETWYLHSIEKNSI